MFTLARALQDSSWESKRVRSAYVKAVHVARFAEGAAAAQRHRESKQQQQISSSAGLAVASLCAWPTTAQLKQKSTASADYAIRMQAAVAPPSSCQGSAPVAFHLGKPPTFKKLPSSNSPAPGHSRLGSHETALADQQPQHLSRWPSTIAGHTTSRHAPPPKSHFHAGPSATVDCVPLQGTHVYAVTDSLGRVKPGAPSTESAAALRSNPTQESLSSGNSSRGASPARKAPEKAELGSLDAALQRQSKAPNEAWCAALRAADLGHQQESECSRLLNLDLPRHSHTCLTLSNMLRFAQQDLSSSNDSSPALSPRPPSRAIDSVPGLKACCAVAEPNSPGITPRPVVNSRDLGVGRFEGHPVGDADEHVEEMRERAALLAVRLAAQASSETQNGINKTASTVKVMLHDQVGTQCVR